MWGLLNGNIGVAKTYLAEISDDSNSAKGMALFGVIGGFGRTIGPVIGGFLSLPADNYPSLFKNTVFETYPFALPSIFVALNCVVVFLISYFYLPETLPPPPKSVFETCENSNIQDKSTIKKLASLLESQSKLKYSLLKNDEDDFDDSDIENRNPMIEMKPLSSSSSDQMLKIESLDQDSFIAKQKKKSLTFNGIVEFYDFKNLSYGHLKGAENDKPIYANSLSEADDSTPIMTPNSPPIDTRTNLSQNILIQYSNGASDYNESENKGIFHKITYLLSRNDIFVSTLMYGTNAFVFIIANEIFPLWIVTPESDGGFNFTSHDIGITTMICGVVTIIFQAIIYPWLVARYGTIAIYKLGVFIFSIGCICAPSISLLNTLDSPFLIWFSVIIIQILQSLTSLWVLITIFVFINNSCYSHQRATVNGIGQTFASLGRLSGPYLGAVLFAWSENNHLYWPMNYYLTFYLLTIVAMCNYFLVNALSPKIVRRRREPFVNNRPNPRKRRVYRDEDEDEMDKHTTSSETKAG